MRLDLTVAAFIVREDKVLLLLHRNLDKWLPPGGHLRQNETPDDALLREVNEEVGIRINLVDRPTVKPCPDIKSQLARPFYVNVHSVGDHDHCCLFYLATVSDKREPIAKDKLEVKAVHWFSDNELHDPTIGTEVTEDVREIAYLALKKSAEIGAR